MPDQLSFARRIEVDCRSFDLTVVSGNLAIVHGSECVLLTPQKLASLIHTLLDALRETGALTPRGRALTSVAQQEILRGAWF